MYSRSLYFLNEHAKSSSERLKIREKSIFFVFEIFIYFLVNLPSAFVIQEQLDPLSNRRFQKDIYSFLGQFLK